MPAGSAVVYQTGIPHCVHPVTRGSRICAIYWFQSLIREPNVRRALWDLHCLQRRLVQAGASESALQAESIKANLIRCLAEV